MHSLQVVTANPDALSSSVGAETVLLHFTAGTYFGLDEIGARIWGLIQAPHTVAEIEAALLAEYEVGDEQCERAVTAFLESLEQNGLVTIGASPAD